VLSQTDLYLLQTELQINPVLTGQHPSFNLVFSLLTGAFCDSHLDSTPENSYTSSRPGQSAGFNADARDRDLQFTQKSEPATLPRVAQLIIITQHSPWCTIVKNDKGVTNEDVINALWKECVPLSISPSSFMLMPVPLTHSLSYSEQVTEAEFASIPPRVQEHIKRTAANNLQMLAGGNQWQFYTPVAPPNQYKRVGTCFALSSEWGI
jgi:hypothetical protein